MHNVHEPQGDADIAAAAALFSEPARARMLMALADGRALPASMLAGEAGITAQATSSHLKRLREAGLVEVEPSGRHRYYRLAGPDVAAVLEALAGIAPAPGHQIAASGHPCPGDAKCAHLLRPSCRTAGRGHHRRPE